MSFYIVELVFWLGWSALLLGALCTVVLALFVIDWAITKIMKYLKVYPLLMDFIWNREKFREWLKKVK